MNTKYFLFFLLSQIVIFSVGCNRNQPQSPPVDCANIPLPGASTGYQMLGDDTSDYAAVYNPSNKNEIVYVKTISHLHSVKLYKANLNTGDTVFIANCNNFISLSKWSTTDWIVFGSNDFQIYKCKSDGSSLTKLTSSGSNFNPDWSPDGSKIVFKQGSHLYTMHNDGSTIKPVDSSIKGVDFPAWSPDGSKIAFSAVIDLTPYIGYFDTITKTKIILTSLIQGENVSGISWFPKSDWIVLATSIGLYKININNMQKVKLRPSCDSRSYLSPSVSPDGTNIIVNRYDLKVIATDTTYFKNYEYIIDSDGSNEMKVNLK